MDWIGVSFEPAEGNVMKRQPRDPTTKHFCWKDGITYNKCWVANGFGHSGHSVLAIHANIPHWQTIAFTVLF
jgi:Ca2+-transporting ATPase